MKFAASYSGGKESALAVHTAIQQGHNPIALITTYNIDADRSHFHGLSEEVLTRVSNALGIPLWLVKTTGAEYQQNFEAALRKAKDHGAEACVFGDIDIEGHIKWCSDRCETVGLIPLFPLLGQSRKDVVYKFIDSGFVANLTVINTDYLSEDFLGQQLTRDLAQRIAATGADICGESGEYHTFVSDGPIFKHPICFALGEKAEKDNYAMIPVIKTKYESCCPICENGNELYCDFSILVDEIACTIGLLRSHIRDTSLQDELQCICKIVYNLSTCFRDSMTLTMDDFYQLENFTLQHKKFMPNPPSVVLPMGSQAASVSHILRVKCKAMVRLLCKHGFDNTAPLLQDFTNLLSGYFYYLAFRLNKLEGVEEIKY